jgi:G3E family GTPase
MPPKPVKKVPIILLSGFLGAGKTTTLQHLLENSDGAKIGVIVNDVASVNIDAKLVAASQDGVVELQNGCACCSLADELLGSVNTLLSNGRTFDALVVELSGVADPIAIKQNWNQAKMQNHPITAKADVSKVVTLIDACTFGTDWMTWDLAAERDGWVDPVDECAGQRKVPELLAEQVEAADLILINKVDLAGDNVGVASGLARELNEKAIIMEVRYGEVSPELILQDLPEDQNAESCQDSDSSHDKEKSRAPKKATSTADLGITSFIYRSSRPFNPRKLMGLLNKWPVPIKEELDLDLLKEAQDGGYEVEGQNEEASPFTGVLRSKGFCWFAPTRWEGPSEDVYRHDTAMYWSHAGKHFGISSAGKWWGTISKEQMVKFFQSNTKEYERILREDFVSEEFGDRRQEIVFIGVSLNEEEIISALDQCLVTEKGMERYRQELRNYMNTIYTTPAGGAGLFDVGSVDHMDLEEN